MRRWSKECDFIQRTDWPRRWQTNVPIVLSGAGCQVLYGSEMRGGEQTELKKKTFNSCKYLLEWQTPDRGNVFILLSCRHFTGGVKWTISCHINKQGCHTTNVKFWAMLAISMNYAILHKRNLECHCPSQVWRVSLSPCELNKGSLRVTLGGGQDGSVLWDKPLHML